MQDPISFSKNYKLNIPAMVCVFKSRKLLINEFPLWDKKFSFLKHFFFLHIRTTTQENVLCRNDPMSKNFVFSEIVIWHATRLATCEQANEFHSKTFFEGNAFAFDFVTKMVEDQFLENCDRKKRKNHIYLLVCLGNHNSIF